MANKERDKNKVKYGLDSLYYALLNETDGVFSYGTPKKLPGAVSYTGDPQGDEVRFHADNGIYFSANANAGYQGDLEVALFPDEFREEIWGEKFEGDTGIQYETANSEQKEFALLMRFSGDKSKTLHALYRCTASRPSISSHTNEDGIEVQTETSTITVMPRLDNELIKAKVSDPTSEAYANWFTAVQVPVIQ